jgi:hypothetical protein
MISQSLPAPARSLDPPVCNRCGRCCHYKDPQGIIRKCRYLVQLGSKTHCRIYSRRLGTLVGIAELGPIYCCDRSLHGPEPGCPFRIRSSCHTDSRKVKIATAVRPRPSAFAHNASHIAVVVIFLVVLQWILMIVEIIRRIPIFFSHSSHPVDMKLRAGFEFIAAARQ